jgi:hypothetical protein
VNGTLFFTADDGTKDVAIRAEREMVPGFVRQRDDR